MPLLRLLLYNSDVTLLDMCDPGPCMTCMLCMKELFINEGGIRLCTVPGCSCRLLLLRVAVVVGRVGICDSLFV